MAGNLYRRHLMTETMDAYFPTSVMPVPDILEHKERPFSPTYAPSKTLSFTVPPAGALGDCQAFMPIVPSGPPTKAAHFSVERDSDSQAFTVTTSSGSLSQYECRVYPGRPFVDFHSSIAGDDVTITYTAGWTQITGDMLRRLFVEMNAVQTSLDGVLGASNLGNNIITATASEDILKGTFMDLFLEGLTLKWKISTSAEPWAYATAAISNTAAGNGVANGIVTNFAQAGDFTRSDKPPAGAYLMASIDVPGTYTWVGDGTSAYNLDANENHTVIGRFIGGDNALIMCNQHARWNQGSA